MAIRLLQFSPEFLDLHFKLVYYQNLRIKVLDRNVGDKAGSCCVIQGANVLFDVPIAWGEACDHQGVGVSS